MSMKSQRLKLIREPANGLPGDVISYSNQDQQITEDFAKVLLEQVDVLAQETFSDQNDECRFQREGSKARRRRCFYSPDYA